MAERVLSEHETALGRAILLATDVLDMQTEGAFWLYDDGDDKWRYFLVTSLFGRIDQRDVYLCLNESLEKILSETEISEMQIFIASPEEGLAREMMSQIKTSPYVSEPKKKFVEIDGKKTSACIYRLSNELAADQAKKAQRKFRQSCREIAAAA